MVKINIVAVGKVKENYFSDGIKEYQKRLSKYASVQITEVKEENFLKGETEAERLQIIEAEAENILKKLKGKITALCIEGEKQSSEKFSYFIKNCIDCGEEITFVIGGSYGLSERVKKIADKKLSFSDMTFPHTMTRLILLEQIYRAFTIINNSTYHK